MLPDQPPLIMNAGVAFFSRPRPSPELLPFFDKSKAEERAYLPEALRPLVWPCRRPVWSRDGLREECGACKACRFRNDGN